jgi:ubiquinone biosynthesis protein
MILEAVRAARDLGRLHDIASVLVRHGFGDLVDRLGIGSVLRRAGRALRLRPSPHPHIEPPERVRRVLEELGPTFVKLGQLLAGRRDLLSPDFVDELSRLHEEVEPLPFDALRERVTAALGKPPEEVFAEFTEEALAAGSIAQVHRALTREGAEVVLKVRRPGTREKVEADLRLLARLADLAESEEPELARYRPKMIVRQLARSLRDEMDMRIEARNADAIALNFKGESGLLVPRIHKEWTSDSVCVLDLVEGVSAARWARTGQPPDLDRTALAGKGAEYVLRMVLDHGLYHADPHPGNVVFLPDGRIGLLDFGMVGRLTDSRRRELVELFWAAVRRDERRLVDLLLEWGDSGDVDLDVLAQDCRAFLDRYHGLRLDQLDAAQLLVDLTTLVRDNDLILPGDVAMLIKVFLTLEGFGRLLDPGFDMTAHMEPFVERAVREYLSPTAAARRGLAELVPVIAHLPRDLSRLAERVRHGRMKLELDLKRLDRFGRQLDRSTNRLTMGIVTAALIIGTAIVMTIDAEPKLLGLPIVGFIGFATSAVMGFVLLLGILRSPRP